jgi:hypothetical protein
MFPAVMTGFDPVVVTVFNTRKALPLGGLKPSFHLSIEVGWLALRHKM